VKILTAGLLVGAIWSLAPGLAFPALVVAMTILIIDSLLREPKTGPVRIVTRMPTRYERDRQRRWGWAVGIGLTHWGPFPFITLYRRGRR